MKSEGIKKGFVPEHKEASSFGEYMCDFWNTELGCGKIYNGTVVTIKDFGAFVNIMPGIDGMLHISQISDKRIDKVEDVLKVGDEIKVRLEAIDDKGRLSLSMKHLD